MFEDSFMTNTDKLRIRLYEIAPTPLMTRIFKKMAGEGGVRTVRIFQFLTDFLILPKSPNSLTFLEIGT